MRVPARFTLLLAAAALLALPAAAQRVDPNRVFDVTLQVDEQVMSATIRDGGMFRLTLDQTDEYRLVPVVSGADGRTVTMAVYRGTSGQPSTSRIVERIELTVGRPATLRTNPGLTMVVDRIRSAPPERQAAAPQSSTRATLASWRRVAQDGNCCVCCGRACACACGVEMSCGSCCMPGCCNIHETSAPAGSEDARRAVRLATYLGGGTCDRPFGAAAPRTVLASR